MRGLESLDTYYNLVPIQKHRLDDELAIQAELMFRITSSKAASSARARDLKDQLERAEAKIYRETALNSVTKMTVPELNGCVARDPERIRRWEAYQAAVVEAEKWEGLVEAWKQRGFALKSLADLYLANYYTVDSAGDGTRRITKEEEHTSNRQAISDSRKGRPAVSDPPPRRRSILE